METAKGDAMRVKKQGLGLSSILLAGLALSLCSGAAEAQSTLRIEVRESGKSRLISADVYLRTTSGALVRKIYASGGRVQLANAPVGTFKVEARARGTNLVAHGRVTIRRRSYARIVLHARGQGATAVGTTAYRRPNVAPRPGSGRRAGGTVRGGRYGGNRRAVGRGATVSGRNIRQHRPYGSRRAAPQGRRISGHRATSRYGGRRTQSGRSSASHSGRVIGSSRRAGTVGAARNYGSGRRRVCRGDVYDRRGRRLSGSIDIFRGSHKVGRVSVVSGYFSLFDLSPGSYRLRFYGGGKSVSTMISVSSNRLARAILRVR